MTTTVHGVWAADRVPPLASMRTFTLHPVVPMPCISTVPMPPVVIDVAILGVATTIKSLERMKEAGYVTTAPCPLFSSCVIVLLK